MQVNREGIREHMEVIGADGGHVGTVDKLEGERIKLTRGDRGAGGRHHWIPLSLVADVEESAVRLAMTADRVPAFWEGEESSAQSPLGGGDAQSGGMGDALTGTGGQSMAHQDQGGQGQGMDRGRGAQAGVTGAGTTGAGGPDAGVQPAPGGAGTDDGLTGREAGLGAAGLTGDEAPGRISGRGGGGTGGATNPAAGMGTGDTGRGRTGG